MSPPIATFSRVTQEAEAKSIAVSPEQGIKISFFSENISSDLSKSVLESMLLIK